MNNDKPRSIILSDMVNKRVLFRYTAPYMLAHSLRKRGHTTKVIDWFTKLPNFGMDVITQNATDDLKFVFISSTFIMSQVRTEEELNTLPMKDFNERHLDMVSDTLWFQSKEEMSDWFSTLRAVLQKKSPDVKFVLGGGTAIRIMHFIPELADHIDLVVSGYGEEAVVHLMEDGPIETSTYNGFNYWRVPADIQPLRACAFEMHKDDNFQPEEAGILEFSRGCKFNCKFCSYDRGRSAHLTEDELRDVLLKNYDTNGTTAYNFIDNCINDSYEKIKIIHRVSKSLPFDLEWVSFVRPEVFYKFPEMMDLILESGAGGLFYGIETLHPKAGLTCGKGGSKERLMELMMSLQEKTRNHAYTVGSFIIGIPNEPKESIYKSMDWVFNERPFHFSIFGSLVLPHPDYVKATTHMTYENNGFSAFSLNPEKYGFEFTNKYKFIGEWKHDNMTFSEANKLCYEQLSRANREMFIPRNAHYDFVGLRSAGFSREEIMHCANHGTTEDFREFRSKEHEVSKKAIQRYLDSL